MPQRALFHGVVVEALKRDGWTITNDPLELAFGDRIVFADLGAEGPIGAEKGSEKIAVEVKSFIGKSDIHELELAVGQYKPYQAILKHTEPNRSLFLAIPHFSYEGIFSEPIGQLMVREEQLFLIVFNDQERRIVKWIK